MKKALRRPHSLGTIFLVGIFISFLSAFPQTNQSEDNDGHLRLVCAGMGFQNGYLDGYDIGHNDSRYKGITDVTIHPLYQNADRGYIDNWVYRVVYQNAYRRGMTRGYSDGFNKKENLVIKRFTQLEEAVRQADTVPVRQQREQRKSGPVVLPAGSRVLLILNDYITTKMNERGDPFSTVVARDVFVGNELVIPEGAVINGTVGQVKQPGRVKGKAEMNLRFNQIVFKGGYEQNLSATLTGVGKDAGRIKDTEGTYEGSGSEGRDAAIITAGAGTGTIVGAIAGGGKGGLIGATIGGLVGLAGVLTSRGKDIELTKGTLLEIMIDQDLRIEKRPRN